MKNKPKINKKADVERRIDFINNLKKDLSPEEQRKRLIEKEITEVKDRIETLEQEMDEARRYYRELISNYNEYVEGSLVLEPLGLNSLEN